MEKWNEDVYQVRDSHRRDVWDTISKEEVHAAVLQADPALMEPLERGETVEAGENRYRKMMVTCCKPGENADEVALEQE